MTGVDQVELAVGQPVSLASSAGWSASWPEASIRATWCPSGTAADRGRVPRLCPWPWCRPGRSCKGSWWPSGRGAPAGPRGGAGDRAGRKAGRSAARPRLASRAGHWRMRTHPGANQTWRTTYTVSTQHFSRRVPDDRRVPIGCPCTDERSGNSW